MFAVTGATLIDVGKGVVQRFWVIQLRANFGVARHAARCHHLAAPRIDVATRTVTADLRMRGDTAQHFFAGLGIERAGAEHRGAVDNRRTADDQQRDQSGYQTEWGQTP